MKKLALLIAGAIVAVSAETASAAAIDWQLNTATQVKFDTKSVGKNATAYVVYLGTASISDYSMSDVIAMDTVKSTATSLGAVKNVAITVDSESGLGNYAVYMSFVSDDVTYYNVSSSVYRLTADDVTALLEEGTALPTSSFAFASTVNSLDDGKSVSNVSVGGGWAAVPEPSTAALALAGLALLLKRRKA